ncbi:MAG: DNA-3-methyladenine glycosylase 2 family protein [Candidatus Aenigmarchaeota archaeon]|nr:DNA-3-methyladenine glycosylase 2 family protein [Candidatus Aenigmarchaeota archaeon]
MGRIILPLRDDFSLDIIVRHKPFFFFFSDRAERVVRLGGKLVTMSFSQEGQRLAVDLDIELDDSEKDLLKERISYCLGTMGDFSDLYMICRDDKILGRFMDKIFGNRLLSAFTDFEALVSIICSQNVSFAQYKAMVAKIVDAYGEGKVFPDPCDILADTSLLKCCGVGYRAGFIENIARFMEGKDKVEDVYRLSSVKGIGPYSVDIFMLFQKRRYDFFYVDSLIKKIIRNDYGADISSDKDIRAFAENHWGRYKGLCEVYLQKLLYDN